MTSSVRTSGRRGAPTVFIVADDLTGAADSAAACAKRGLDTVVALGETGDVGLAEALALDADTRRLTRDAAAAKTARLVRARSIADKGVLFKKIDSTLRGHIGAEIAALLDARRRMTSSASGRGPVAVLAAAFPALGRTTVGGRQRLNGAPLENTEFWPQKSMTSAASLPEMMKSANLASGLAPLVTVRRGEDALRAAMIDVVDRVDVVVCDAETDEDLGAVARASLRLGRDVVWVGSAGLVGHLVDAHGLTRRTAAVPRAISLAGPLLFVVGSLSATSRRQAALLAAQDVVTLTLEGAMIDDGRSLTDLADRLAAALCAGKDVLLLSESKTSPSPSESIALQGALADLIAPHAARIGGLFATGGETARAALSGLDVASLRLVAEIEHGVPLSIADGPRRLPVITKAGGFGEAATMVNCRRFLREWGSAVFGPASSNEARP